MSLPDVARIVRDFLLQAAPVTARVGNRVYIIRLSPDVVFPCLLLTGFDQRSITPHVDHAVDALIQIEAFGATGGDWHGARTTLAVAHDLMRSGLATYGHVEGVVSAVLPESGFQPLPDDEHDKARWVASVRVIAY